MQGGIFIFGDGEDAAVRPEGLFGSRQVRVASTYFFDGIKRLSAFVFLLVDFPATEYLSGHVCGECVYARYTHAVQTAGYFIRTFVELAACVQHGHNDFQSGFLFLLVPVYRNTATVVLYGDGVVFIDGDFDVVAIAGHGFVDGVVHHFVHQMVQTVLADVSDIHGGTFPHGFQSFQNLNVACGIVALADYLFFFSHNIFSYCNNRANILNFIET